MSGYPRVLILGQPFNYNSGGGITLSNLFKDWPKERIAVLFAPWDGVTCSRDVCDIYYQIGADEHKWKFPFSIFKQPFPPSGIIGFSQTQSEITVPVKKSLKTLIAGTLVNPLLYWLGLYHSASEIKISLKLKTWLEDYDPEIIYIQVSSLEGIVFSGILKDYLKVPAVIHMMDDWPSTISNQGPLMYYWKHKIDRELKNLFDKMQLHLSICDEMSVEYKIRYGKVFTAFHNPIETSIWMGKMKRDFLPDNQNIKVLFAGRIGTGISTSLTDVASAIESLNEEGLHISFNIQTTSKEHEILRRLAAYKCIAVNPVANYEELPGILSGADILLLANDFDDLSISFLRLSMPTKASEYMISGTPILVYSSGETAVSKFFSLNECGCCVMIPSRKEIMNAIRMLIYDVKCRERISRNAVKIALDKFDAEKVRSKFGNLLTNLIFSNRA